VLLLPLAGGRVTSLVRYEHELDHDQRDQSEIDKKNAPLSE
jgi:hypothetical protein